MTTTHTLPDGNIITVEGTARHGCVEALFQPGRYGLGDVPGVSDAVLAAVMVRCRRSPLSAFNPKCGTVLQNPPTFCFPLPQSKRISPPKQTTQLVLACA